MEHGVQHNSPPRRRKPKPPGIATATVSPRRALRGLQESLLAAAWLCLAGIVGLSGCARSSPSHTGRTPNESTSATSPRSEPSAATSSAASPSRAAPSTQTAPPLAPSTDVPCDPFACLRFPTAAAALRHVLETDSPEVLGIGESHARAETEHIPSATARFTDELLPVIADRSHALVVELLAPPSDCRPETRERVDQEERAITEGQASANQNQYLRLGHEAKRLGVTPYILRATCGDLDAIAAAGEEGVLVMMETIARLTTQEVQRLLARRPPERAQAMVLAYGGALHNDLAPRSGREGWSYGPHLQELTGGSYTELDLIVPEHIQDTDSWRAQPWYDAVPPLTSAGSVLLQVAPRRWVLFLSTSPPDSPPSEPRSSEPRPAEPRSDSQEPAQEL